MIITFSLLLIGISFSILFSYYLSTERLNIIDNQLNASANVLFHSNLKNLMEVDFEKSDKLINDLLGPNRIGKIFYIRNEKDEIIFRSKSAILAKFEFPLGPNKFTIKNGDKTFRVLNLSFPGNSVMTLQSAIILDTEDFQLMYIFKKLMLYLLIIFLPILGLAILLTNYILKPLTILSAHLEQVGLKLKKSGVVDDLPLYFDQFKKSNVFKKDEFGILINSISSFFDRLNLYYKITKPWSYQLAHEIKTPLSILNIEIDSLTPKDELIAIAMKEQVEKISHTVSSFLDWATIENSFNDSNLYAIRISNYLEKIKNDLDKIYPNRIKLNVDSNFTLICNPDHLIQVISNIIINSLKHSNFDVEIQTDKYLIAFIDYGEGIPAKVLERYGQPFNFGQSLTKGNGLGLAWISTLSKFYNWDINFEKNESNFTTRIDFSKNSFGLEN